MPFVRHEEPQCEATAAMPQTQPDDIVVRALAARLHEFECEHPEIKTWVKLVEDYHKLTCALKHARYMM